MPKGHYKKSAKQKKHLFGRINQRGRSKRPAKSGCTLWDFCRAIEDADVSFRVRLLQTVNNL